MDIQSIGELRKLLSRPQINGKYIFDPANRNDVDVNLFLTKHSENKWIKFLTMVNETLGLDGTEHSTSDLAAIEQDLIKYIKDSYGSDESETVNPLLMEDIRGKTPEAKLIAGMNKDELIKNAVSMAILQTEKLKTWVEPKPGLLDNLRQLFSKLGDKLEGLFDKILKFSEKTLPVEKPETESTTAPSETEAPPQEAPAQIVEAPPQEAPVQIMKQPETQEKFQAERRKAAEQAFMAAFDKLAGNLPKKEEEPAKKNGPKT